MKKLEALFKRRELMLADSIMTFMQNSSFTQQGFGVPLLYLSKCFGIHGKTEEVVPRLAEEGYLSFKPYKGREGKESNRIYLSSDYLKEKSEAILHKLEETFGKDSKVYKAS